MFHLSTLGGIRLDRDGQPLTGAAVRSRSLALLALLASHREQGMSRDKVVAYLWPESDAKRARNSLKQLLFSFHHAVGRQLAVSSGAMLRLDSSALEVDVWQFEDALAQGREAVAVVTYRGPFLDGFYASGLSELEWWLESERDRLARQYTDALRTLARKAEATGDRSGAVTWYRTLAAAEPLSSANALMLMRALVASGDPTKALEHAREHSARVHAELGIAAAGEVIAYADELCSRPPPAEITFSRPLPALSALPGHPVRRWASGGRPMVASASQASADPISPPLVTPTWPVLVAAIAAAALLLLAVTRGSENGMDRAAFRDGSATVTVLPFVVTGEPTLLDLGAGLQELLAARLDGADRLRTVPVTSRFDQPPGQLRLDRETGAAMARRAAARFYVIGRLVGAGDRLQATATLYDRGNANAPAARAEAAVEGRALFELADLLAAQLIAELYRDPDERLTGVAVGSTRSLPALKAYLEGERHFREDSLGAAIDAFRRAVRADTAFSLAYYRLSVAADWDGQEDLALWAATLAGRFSARLSDHERHLVQAYLVHRRGRIDEAERLYRRIVAEYPEDAEGWFQLAEVLFHSNPLRGRSIAEARQVLQRVLAFESYDREALVHLARIAALEGGRAEADSLVRQAIALAPDSLDLALRAFRTFALGDRPGVDRATDDLTVTPGLLSARTALTVAVYMDPLETERLATVLTRAPSSCAVRALGQRMLAQIAFARGHPRRAMTLLRTAGSCDPAAALALEAIYATVPFLPPDSGELATLRRALESTGDPVREHPAGDATGPFPPAMREYYIGLLALGSGDTSRARRAVLALTGVADSSAPGEITETLKRSLRARLALAMGQPARALALLETTRWEQTGGSASAETADRFLRAELLHALGREDEAIGWYRSIAERSSHELVYLAPAELRLAEIYQRRLESAEASRHFRRFRELWQKPEPAVQSAMADEVARLTTLP
jgi:serine/threonine-protein kinase